MNYDWREDEYMHPAQKAACAWLDHHGIDPSRVPLTGVQLWNNGSATVRVFYQNEHGGRELDRSTGDVRMADPITFDFKVEPSEEVISFFEAPNAYQIDEREW